MEYDWDEAKREANIAERGIDFALVEGFDWDAALVMTDERHYDEKRHIAVGPIGEVLYVLVFTWRGETIRVISLRCADRLERKAYVKAKQAESG